MCERALAGMAMNRAASTGRLGVFLGTPPRWPRREELVVPPLDFGRRAVLVPHAVPVQRDAIALFPVVANTDLKWDPIAERGKRVTPEVIHGVVVVLGVWNAAAVRKASINATAGLLVALPLNASLTCSI